MTNIYCADCGGEINCIECNPIVPEEALSEEELSPIIEQAKELLEELSKAKIIDMTKNSMVAFAIDRLKKTIGEL